MSLSLIWQYLGKIVYPDITMSDYESEDNDPTYHPDTTDDDDDEYGYERSDQEIAMCDDLAFFVSERHNLTPVQKDMFLAILYALVQEQEDN